MRGIFLGVGGEGVRGIFSGGGGGGGEVRGIFISGWLGGGVVRDHSTSSVSLKRETHFKRGGVVPVQQLQCLLNKETVCG